MEVLGFPGNRAEHPLTVQHDSKLEEITQQQKTLRGLVAPPEAACPCGHRGASCRWMGMPLPHRKSTFMGLYSKASQEKAGEGSGLF